MTTQRVLRILVVDDSAYVRKIVSQLLSRSPFLEVVGTARDGCQVRVGRAGWPARCDGTWLMSCHRCLRGTPQDVDLIIADSRELLAHHGIGEEAARALIARHDRTVTVAAFNGPRSLTLAGARNSLEAMAAELESQEVFARFVQVEHPFHHYLMQPASEALEEALEDLRPQAETIPYFSTVTGGRCAGGACDGAYWGRGVRQPVQFASAVGELMDAGVDVWLELSAHPALVHSIQECLTERGNAAPTVCEGQTDPRFRRNGR